MDTNKKITPEWVWDVYNTADRLYSAEEVEASVRDIARQINRAYAKDNPILVTVLNGGVVLIGQLLPMLDFPLEIDYVHATRYRDNVGGEELSWISGPHCDAKGRTVILVDDILDEGNTLSGIVDFYRKAGADKVVTVVLVVKNRERKTDIKPNITGLTVPDRYVFGYGMDYKGYWRNAPGIYAERE